MPAAGVNNGMKKTFIAGNKPIAWKVGIIKVNNPNRNSKKTSEKSQMTQNTSIMNIGGQRITGIAISKTPLNHINNS